MELFILFAQIIAVLYLIIAGAATVWFIWMTTCHPQQWLKICEAEQKRAEKAEL